MEASDETGKIRISMRFIGIKEYYAVFKGVKFEVYNNGGIQAKKEDSSCYYYYSIKHKIWLYNEDIEFDEDVYDYMKDIFIPEDIERDDQEIYYTSMDRFTPLIENCDEFIKAFSKTCVLKVNGNDD